MALTAGELARIKAELGYNVLSVGADLYVGVVAIFEQVIQPYLTGATATTSSTAVTAASTPTPFAITLASATGFAAGGRVVIDVDDREEIATMQSLAGAVMTVQIKKAHSGTYPVMLEGPESLVREVLHRIREVKTRLATVLGYGALKKVDEIEFYQSGTSTQFGLLGQQLTFWREELAALLGVPSLWSQKRAAGSTISVY